MIRILEVVFSEDLGTKNQSGKKEYKNRTQEISFETLDEEIEIDPKSLMENNPSKLIRKMIDEGNLPQKHKEILTDLFFHLVKTNFILVYEVNEKNVEVSYRTVKALPILDGLYKQTNSLDFNDVDKYKSTRKGQKLSAVNNTLGVMVYYLRTLGKTKTPKENIRILGSLVSLIHKNKPKTLENPVIDQNLEHELRPF